MAPIKIYVFLSDEPKNDGIVTKATNKIKIDKSSPLIGSAMLEPILGVSNFSRIAPFKMAKMTIMSQIPIVFNSRLTIIMYP